jgi:hypothetical protein
MNGKWTLVGKVKPEPAFEFIANYHAPNELVEQHTKFRESHGVTASSNVISLFTQKKKSAECHFHSGECGIHYYANCCVRPPAGARLPRYFCEFLKTLVVVKDKFWSDIGLYFKEWCENYPFQAMFQTVRGPWSSSMASYKVRSSLPCNNEEEFANRITCAEIFMLFSLTSGNQHLRDQKIVLVSTKSFCVRCSAVLLHFACSLNWDFSGHCLGYYEDSLHSEKGLWKFRPGK